MLFNSLKFGLFLPVVFAVYWAFPKKWKWIVLLIFSYYFYMSWNVKYVVLIWGTSFISYICALLLEKSKSRKVKKIYLTLTIVICLGVLFFFKYFNFFSSSISEIFQTIAIPIQPITLNILLPVGISFYTFQSFSYVIDVYRGNVKAEKNFGKYATFISFFPQLVAGPIERTNNLLPQINNPPNFDCDKAIYGLKIMAWGFFKKVAIADALAIYVDNVYNNPRNFEGFPLLFASFLFAIQIYCDFSGYSDIAVGSAKLFGIDLMCNFHSPYFSASIKEFWSRWHISLSQWFRDYVYIPLGGNRCGKLRNAFNLVVTFLLSGLWHGANWTFLLWGFFHGIMQVIEKFILRKSYHKKESSLNWRWFFSVIAVFILCTFAWVFFRASSVNDAFYIIQHLFSDISHPTSYILSGLSDMMIGKQELISLMIPIVLLFIYDFASLKTDVIVWISRRKKVFRWLIYISLFFMIVFLRPVNSGGEFIYFQF